MATELKDRQAEKGAYVALQELRGWAAEKEESGARQVRLSTLIEQLDQAVTSARESKRIAPSGRVTIVPADVMGVVEVAEYLGVERTRPSKWRLLNTKFGPDKIEFPEPYRMLLSGPVWLRQQVEPFKGWVDSRRRKPAAATEEAQQNGKAQVA